MKTKKEIYIITTIFLIIIIISVGIINFFIAGTPTIDNIKVSEKINEDLTKTITLKIHNPFDKPVECAIEKENKTNENTKWEKVKNDKCDFNVNAGTYYLFLKDNKGNIEKIKASNIEINKILNLKLNTEKVYLTLGETYKLKGEIESIGNIDETITYTDYDEKIIKVDDGLITPISNGTTKIKVKTTEKIEKEVTVIVTDLYKKANLNNNNTFLTCNRYTKEENELLDEVLAFKINEAGYQTRGAVVAALRFLVLEFPYKIPYFFENGRLNNYDVIKHVDGEGRYYKKGLYLNSYKFDDIVASYTGPATWGCPLMSYHDERQYGYYPGVKYPNGLDCSGFVTWVLYNAGYDIGDSGSGDTPRTDDMIDFGERHWITRDYILNGDYKVGDLIGWDGHIALIAGFTKDNIYVAESLPGGVVIKEFSKTGSKFYTLYEFINDMDKVYKNEGTYTNMW